MLITENGANVDAADPNRRTAVMLAAEKRHMHIVKVRCWFQTFNVIFRTVTISL